MTGTSPHNDIVERINCTIMDMACSMLVHLRLPFFLWTKALNATLHILNKVPFNHVPKILYELWTIRKLSVRCMKLTSCLANT